MQQPTTTIESIAWGGWQHCIRMSNGTLELIATADVGPRILHLGMVGDSRNVFYVDDATRGTSGSDGFVMYGGHRLWHAPEHPTRTYQPDNHPVTVAITDQTLTLRAPIEANGIQKSIALSMTSSHEISVQHTMHNHGAWDVQLALWGVSVMRAGGTAVLPLPPRGSHDAQLLPNTRLITWAYTDLSDARWTWGREYVLLRQDTSGTLPQKIGAAVPAGWLAYINDGLMFSKHFAYDAAATYPDMGCNAELFTIDWMLEVESLSPLLTLPPQHHATHTEQWRLVDGVAVPTNDADVQQHVLPHLPHLP